MTVPAASNCPFEALGLPLRFDLEPGEIERAYLARAATNHPDLGGAGGDDLARTSAVLNHAKRALSDPEQRAGALLARLGGAGKSEDKSLPDGFLMEMMEVRQRIEGEIGDPEGRQRWQGWADEQRAGFVERAGGLFSGLGDEPEKSELGAIRRELNAWRYIERLIEQLDPEYNPAVADFE